MEDYAQKAIELARRVGSSVRRERHWPLARRLLLYSQLVKERGLLALETYRPAEPDRLVAGMMGVIAQCDDPVYIDDLVFGNLANREPTPEDALWHLLTLRAGRDIQQGLASDQVQSRLEKLLGGVSCLPTDSDRELLEAWLARTEATDQAAAANQPVVPDYSQADVERLLKGSPKPPEGQP
jgi:hypothetical protein